MTNRHYRVLGLVLLMVVTSSVTVWAETTISLWSPWGSGAIVEGLNAIIEDFEVANPGYKVDVLIVPAMDDKLMTSIVGGVAPDVAILDRFTMGQWGSRGALVDLTSLAAESGLDYHGFYDAPQAESMYNGEIYGVPFNTDVRVLYWNKEHFREVGLDPDVPPTSWEEIVEFSDRLVKRRDDGSLERVGFIPTSGNTTFYYFLWANGGEVLTADGRQVLFAEPEGVGALEWIVEFMNRYGVSDLVKLEANVGLAPDQGPFTTGIVSMIGDGNWLYRDIQRYVPDMDIGVAPLPAPEGKEQVTWSGGHAFVIPRGSKNPDAAWNLMSYFVEPEVNARFAQISGQLPSVKDAAQAEFYQNDPIQKLFVDQLYRAKYRPVTPAGGLIKDRLDWALQRAIRGWDEPQSLLEQSAARVQSELDKL